MFRPVTAVLLALGLALAIASCQQDDKRLQELPEKAEQGDAGAQYNLGLMCDMGEGVPQDYTEAVKWYRLAADQGEAKAPSNLGFMYVKGDGVPQDYVLAHQWINRAASRSTGEEREKRVKARHSIAEEMTPEQIAEAQRLAREWKSKMQEN